MNIFAELTKKGLSFKTDRGLVSVQDVWQMPLTGNKGFNLDTLSRELLKTVRATEEDSLVVQTVNVNKDDELRLEVLKFIIKDKQEAKAASEEAAEKALKRQELQRLIASKQQEAQASKSLEELQQELLDLEK